MSSNFVEMSMNFLLVYCLILNSMLIFLVYKIINRTYFYISFLSIWIIFYSLELEYYNNLNERFLL